MNGRVFRMDVPAHQAVQELLPWYASSQLAADEARRVRQHLQECAQCRHELEWEHGMRAEAAATGDTLPDGVDMERALAKLMPALGPQERTAAPLPWWRMAAANQPGWLRWAVAAQCVLIIGLAALLLRPQPAAEYHVLGAGSASGANLVVVFQPNTSERELRSLLQAQNARVIDGPTVTDAYLLSVPTERRAQALQALRGASAVKLAEPLDGGATP
ncbi:hypothetical protein GTP45_09365 [Pseudoduganella sp. FT55W]|uniref:Zinc-finger domain-containing protein n=2 Tax=Duganella rivi TaxID=2666083 RepID=A0A7X4GP03_9BURK|nr:zf-HC2 domain-containing protein [Duganella rivi]MYM67035.1 hypothetical protein [Duganella rivi]